MTKTKKYVSIGRLGKSRGIHGEVYVTPTTDFPERFLNMKRVYVADRDTWEPMTITSARLVAGRPVLKFESINSREDTARLTNRELAVTRDQLVELPEDTYYLFELVGCAAYDASSGRRLGEITDVQQYPANDVYVIRAENGKEVMVPAVRQYIIAVDIENRRVDIEPGGLFDDE